MKVEDIETIRKHYESLADAHVNSHECIKAYHEWYSRAAVLFDEHFSASDAEFQKFRDVNNEGNGYTLRNYYYSILDLYNTAYPYIEDSSIEKIKKQFLLRELLKTETIKVENDGIYTVWTVCQSAMELWARL